MAAEGINLRVSKDFWNAMEAINTLKIKVIVLLI